MSPEPTTSDVTPEELVGSPATGVKATNKADEIIEAEADCVIYMAAEPNSNPAGEGTEAWRSVDVMCRLLASGKNVVSTGISGLINPSIFGEEVLEEASRCCSAGRSTFLARESNRGSCVTLLRSLLQACPAIFDP